MEVFAGHGYQRVKPPLLEFEESRWPALAPRLRSRHSA